MGLFFKGDRFKPAVSNALEKAIAAPPDAANAARKASETAEAIQNQVAGTFAWGRFLIAVGVLVAIFCGCVYTAHDDKLQDLYKVMTHGFELLLGIILGLIGGEAAARG
jgi:hypothetical protein